MYIHVRVTAGAKRESLQELPSKDGVTRLKISVKEPTKQNLANTRVIDLVAEHCDVSRSGVRLVSGHTHPSKIFLLM